MRNLLSANFARLRLNLLFWLCIAAMAGYAVIMLISWYRTNQIILQSDRPDMVMRTDQFLFNFIGLIGILLAAFVGLFLGTEHSDGVLRSKLTVGHSRPAVYLSNLCVAVIASFLMSLTYIVIMLAVGVPVYGPPATEPLVILRTLAEALAMCAAYCALFTLVAMNWGNKALSTVACVLGVLALIWVTSNMRNQLMQPELYADFMFDEAIQDWVESNPRPNPGYVGEPLRSVYRVFYDFLPMGQAMQLTGTSIEGITPERSPLLAAYSLAVTAVSTGLGLLLFRRKDIK